MSNPTAPSTTGLALFCGAGMVTFGCSTAMQFLEKPWFFVVLVAMHGGIALFVASKRTLRARGFELKRYFMMEYAMLLPFLGIMFYTLISKTGALPAWGGAKASITLVYVLICLAATFWNVRRMHDAARMQTAAPLSEDLETAVGSASALVAE